MFRAVVAVVAFTVAASASVVVSQQAQFWCPMHPNQRSPVPATCPICKMTMVPIPAMRIGEYRMDVTQVADPRTGGLSALRIAIRDPETGATVTALDAVHERPLHLFVVSRDLEYFAHVHPVRSAKGTFDVREPIPPGEYMVVADFLPTGGSPQTLQRAIITPGLRAAAPAASLKPGTNEVAANGVHVLLEPDVLAGKNSHLRFSFSEAASRRPVSDFEPYLGAQAHLFIASADLTETMHAHPEETAAGGAQMVFDVTLPKPGQYKMWLQFQRQGKLTTVAFVIDIN